MPRSITGAARIQSQSRNVACYTISSQNGEPIAIRYNANSGGDGVEIGIISPALIDHQICPMILKFSFLVLHLQG